MDQPDGDIDNFGNFCVGWRHRETLFAGYAPVIRCGSIASGTGAITFTTGISQVWPGFEGLEQVGGLYVHMRRLPSATSVPHAVVVNSFPILGAPTNLQDCQGQTHLGSVHFESSDADIVPNQQVSWSTPAEITFDDHFDYCPLQAVATYDRQFSFIIDAGQGQDMVAIPVNQRPGVVLPSSIDIWTRRDATTAWGRQASITVPSALGASLFFPNLAADGEERVGLSFYSGDVATNTQAIRMFAYSEAVGSWTTPVALSAQMQVRNGLSGDRLLLDYQSMTAIPSANLTPFSQGRFFDCWGDTTASFPLPSVVVGGVQIQ